MPEHIDPPPVSSPTPSPADPTLLPGRRQSLAERAWHWWKRHSPTVVVGLLGVILLAAAVAAFLFLRRAKVLTLQGHTDSVWSVAFSPDGQRLVTGSGDSNTPGVVQVWDAGTGQELLTLKGHHDMVWSVAFSPDGKRIASGSFDRTVKVWDAHTGKLLFTLRGHTGHVHSVAFSPDGKRIASGDWDYTVKVWDAHTGQEALSRKGHTDWVNSVAFSPDGKRIASASGGYDEKKEEFWGEVQLWDAQTRKEQLTLKGHAFYVRSVAFSADGKRIVSGSEGLWNISPGEVKVWDAQTGQEQRTLKGHTYQVWSVAFSPDGTRIVSGGWGYDLMANRYWGELKVWDADTGEPLVRQQRGE